MANIKPGGILMAGLMLAAAFSVALASAEPTVTQETYPSVIKQTYNTTISVTKKEDKPVQKEINLQKIIRITGLDPQTSRNIIEESTKEGIDPFLILGLLRTESRFNPKATSRKGARGLGQLMTSVGRWAAKREGLQFSSRSLYNPSYNAKLTVKYFSYLYKAFRGNVHRALTAYNRGIGGLKYYERRYHTSVSSYSKKVLKNTEYMKARYNKAQ